MNSKNLRFEAGGNPAQPAHPDVLNPQPSPAANENFPDAPDEQPAERPQDQPDLQAFAARMGTDRIGDPESRLVPFAELADDQHTAGALRQAAQRGRLDATKQSDGVWLSSRKAVEAYDKVKRKRRPSSG
jgi:hypothetical protein